MDFQKNAAAPGGGFTGTGPYAVDWPKIIKWIGNPDQVAVGQDYTQRPAVSKTIQDVYSNKNVFSTQMFQVLFVGLDDWTTRVAPLMKAPGDSIAEIYEKQSAQLALMTPAPPESTPQFLTVSSEAYRFELTRYHGAIKMNTETLLTAYGQQEMEIKFRAALSSMHATIQTLIKMAIVGAKNEWHAVIRDKSFTSVRDALSPIQENMFIAHKIPRALYTAHKWVLDFTDIYQPRFDTIVVSHGTLNTLIYGLGNEYEVKASGIGEPLNQERLVQGKDSLMKALPGIVIFEDKPIIASNIPVNQLHILRRIVLWGEFTLIDGSDYGMKTNRPDYHATRDSTIVQVDVEQDANHPLSLIDCINNDFAWEGDEPSPRFDDMLNHLQEILTQTGIDLKGRLVDPWICKGGIPTPDGSSRPATHGFHRITVWGNQELEYRHPDKDRAHGHWASVRARNQLHDETLNKILQMQQLTKELFEFNDFLNESVLAYLWCLGANPENAPNASIYLNGHRHGAPLPPYVDRNPGLTNVVQEGNGLNRDQASELQDTGVLYVMINGKRYYLWALEYEDRGEVDFDTVEKLARLASTAPIDDQTGLYTAPDANWALIGKDEVGGAAPLATLDDFTNWNTDDIRNNAEIQFALENERTYLGGKLKGFMLLPFDYFGKVSSDGKAYDWMKQITRVMDWTPAVPPGVGGPAPGPTSLPSIQFMSNEGLFLLAAHALSKVNDPRTGNPLLGDYNGRTINASLRLIGNTMARLLQGQAFRRGIKPPHLVRAPSNPYAFGYINTLRTLADLHTGGTRGWNPETCRKAFECLQPFERYATLLASDYKDCILLREIYTPEFMFTTNPQENIHNNIHFNLVEHAEYPIWVRAAVPYSITSASKGTILSPRYFFFDTEQNDTSIPINRVQLFEDNEVYAIANAMGFQNVTGASLGIAASFGTDPTVRLDLVTNGNVVDRLKLILNNRWLDAALKDILKKSQPGGEASKLFEEFAKNRSNLGNSYARLKREEDPTQNFNRSFASFFIFEIFSLNTTREMGQIMALFNGTLLLALPSMRSTTGFSNELTRAAIDGFKNQGAKRRFEPLVDEIAVEDARKKARDAIGAGRRPFATASTDEYNVDAAIGWLNTRCVMSDSMWHKLESELDQLDPATDQDQFFYLYQLPIRPSNPAHPVEPLAGNIANIVRIPDAAQRAVVASDYKNQFVQFKAARADGSKRSVASNTVLGNVNMFAEVRAPSRVAGGGGARGPEMQAAIMGLRPHIRRRVGERTDPFDPMVEQPQPIWPPIAQDPTGVFNIFEQYVGRDGRELPRDTAIIREHNLQTRYLYAYNNIPELFARIPTLMFLLTKLTRSNVLHWAKIGLPIPDSVYILFRIAAVQADAAVWAESGPNTAKAGYNFLSNTLAIDVGKDTLVLTYKGYFNAIVLDGHRVYIWDAFNCAGYIGGLDNRFYPSPDKFDPTTLHNPQYSIIACRAGSEWNLENALQQNPISLFGKYDPNMFIQSITDHQKRIFTTHQQWPSFVFYNYLVNFLAMKPMISRSDIATFKQLKDYMAFDGNCWIGRHWRYNPSTNKFDLPITGTSARGNAEAPIRGALSGQARLFTYIEQR